MGDVGGKGGARIGLPSGANWAREEKKVGGENSGSMRKGRRGAGTM